MSARDYVDELEVGANIDIGSEAGILRASELKIELALLRAVFPKVIALLGAKKLIWLTRSSRAILGISPIRQNYFGNRAKLFEFSKWTETNDQDFRIVIKLI